MNNVVRKEVRRILEMISQLEKSCSSKEERDNLMIARIHLVKADFRDFHVNPNKRYTVPKSNFQYKNL